MFDEERRRTVIGVDGRSKIDVRIRPRNRGDNPWARLVWGAALLAAGVIGYLDHTGRLDASDYLRWWPLVLIALGLAHLPQRQWITAVVLVVIGMMFLPQSQFLPYMRVGRVLGLWPLLISAGGITLIRQALRPAAKDAARENSFHSVAVMGGVGRSVASSDFVGGDAVAIMGGCEINLAGARIATEAVVDVLAFWGGIEIRVPRGWRIDNQVLAILGGVVDKTEQDVPAGAPTLILRGSAIMGGVEVKHPKR